MQKNHNFLSTLGLCERSGACLIGEAACLAGVRNETVHLLFLDESASGNTQKRFFDACAFHKVMLMTFDAGQWDIALAVGKKGCKLIAITDPKWSESLAEQAISLNIVKSTQGGKE